MERIAVIFDVIQRPETTGVYCRRALSQLVAQGRIKEVEHFLPTELAEAARLKFDLYLFVDDGLDYAIPTDCHPCAWWAIDTHLSFERCLAKARAAEFVFAAQRDGAEQFRANGVATAHWLPLACDPELHGRLETDKQFDLAFVGNLFPGARQDLITLLQENFPNMFVGQRYFEEMAEIYSQARIVFNRSLANDVNMRVFEALCSGSLLLTNDLAGNGQNELFQDGVHLATYTSPEDLVDKARFYLANAEEREQIAQRGRNEVLARHTYRDRIESILEIVKTSRAPSPKTLLPPPRPELADKDATYFEFDRPDVLELVPNTAKRVLDVGCGSGRLGAAIKARQDAEVTGIELDPRSAHAARKRLDHVRIGNIESSTISLEDGSFDCIICADVLEHLRSPDEVLAKLRLWLAPDGVLITSIPNVRNHTVIRSLLVGNWTAESAGLLDSDHVRFFTRRELEKLLVRSGFAVEELRMVPGEGYAEWVQQGRPLALDLGGLRVEATCELDATEFFAYQYLTRSRPVVPVDHGLTSIIIVTHNAWAYTKNCIDSIRLRTDEPYELIVVDNGSTDGTVEYLQSLRDVTLIRNPDNRGFPAAANQGLQVARGKNLLLLNNDTLATTKWLSRMLDVLHSQDDIGLVGPVSNRISGEQQIDVSYSQLNELDGFAWDWGRDHGHEIFETDRLIGFCLLIKREVLDAIGLLDERFGIGNFEDDDFCRRALDAGFKAVVARGAFVHHFGSVTFQNAGIDLNEVLRENQQKFAEKWSLTQEPIVELALVPAIATTPEPAIGTPRPEFIVREGEDGGLLLAPNDIKLSVCLIVRDNAGTIRPCLESIRPWVDEIVVVDTGSTDGTDQICIELGARVFYWAWQDSFSAARNVSLDHARGEWVFWMDSDDVIPAECGRKLRELALGEHPAELFGYVMQVHCPGDEPMDVTVVDHVKLIRNRPELRFEFRIHEQILPAIRRAEVNVAFTDIHVIHAGSDRTKEGQAKKLERDFRLLDLELQERPDHPFVLFNLGMTHADCDQHGQAIEFLTRCITVSQSEESHLRKAYALMISCLAKAKRRADAVEVCENALALFPSDKELLFRKAMLQHELGLLDEAIESYHRILNEKIERHFTSIDVGIDGYKARFNLAIVYEDLGDFAQAELEWRAIVMEQPNYGAAWGRLGEVLLKRNDQNGLNAVLIEMAKWPNLSVPSSLLASRLAETQGDFSAARKLLEEALAGAPDNCELLNELCRLTFEHGPQEMAESLVLRLIDIDPDDPCAWHNLGSLREQRQDFVDAAQAYEWSLKLRPHSELTAEALRRVSGSHLAS